MKIIWRDRTQPTVLRSYLPTFARWKDRVETKREIEYHVKQLKSKDHNRRLHAIKKLRDALYNTEWSKRVAYSVLDRVVEKLDDEDKEVRAAVSEFFSHASGKRDRNLDNQKGHELRLLVKKLEAADRDRRKMMILSLWEDDGAFMVIGQGWKEASENNVNMNIVVDDLVELFECGEEIIKWRIIGTFNLAAEYGVDIPQVSSLLTKAVEDEAETVRRAAVHAFQIKVHRGDRVYLVIPCLLGAMKDRRGYIREEAVEALKAAVIKDGALESLMEAAREGTTISCAVEGLTGLLGDEAHEIRKNTAKILITAGEYGDSQALEAIALESQRFMQTPRFRGERARNTLWYTEVAGYIDKIMRKISERLEFGSTVVGEGATV